VTFKTWLLFFVMETALSLSPGPAVFYVMSQGARGVARAVPATLGILSANAIYFALSATSLGALIAASTRFFTVVKWLGAAYLILLGLKALAAATRYTEPAEATAPGAEVQEDGPRHAPRMAEGLHRGIYLGALSLQASNPKALLFFLALLPQFIDTHRAVAPQMLLLAATSMLPEFCILLAYGWLAQRAAQAAVKFGFTGMNRWLGWVEGFALLGCATLVLKVGRTA
jgi:homoserine/homoserine lactone efflux protein